MIGVLWRNMHHEYYQKMAALNRSEVTGGKTDTQIPSQTPNTLRFFVIFVESSRTTPCTMP
jgi:hypothetical protein